MALSAQVNILGEHKVLNPSTRPTYTLSNLADKLPIRSGAKATLFVVFNSQNVKPPIATDFDGLTSVTASPGLGSLTFELAESVETTIPDIPGAGDVLLHHASVFYLKNSYWNGTNGDLTFTFDLASLPDTGNSEITIFAVEGLPYLDCYSLSASSSRPSNSSTLVLSGTAGPIVDANRFDICTHSVFFDSSILDAYRISHQFGGMIQSSYLTWPYQTTTASRRIVTGTSGNLSAPASSIVNSLYPSTSKIGDAGLVVGFRAAEVETETANMIIGGNDILSRSYAKAGYFTAYINPRPIEEGLFSARLVKDRTVDGNLFRAKLYKPVEQENNVFSSKVALLREGNGIFQARVSELRVSEDGFFTAYINPRPSSSGIFQAEISEIERVGGNKFQAYLYKLIKEEDSHVFSAVVGEFVRGNGVFTAYVNPRPSVTGMFHAKIIFPDQIRTGSGVFKTKLYIPEDKTKTQGIFKARVAKTLDFPGNVFSALVGIRKTGVFCASVGPHEGKGIFQAEVIDPLNYIVEVRGNLFNSLICRDIEENNNLFSSLVVKYQEGTGVFNAQFAHTGVGIFQSKLYSLKENSGLFQADIKPKDSYRGYGVFKAQVSRFGYNLSTGLFSAKIIPNCAIGLNKGDFRLLLNRETKLWRFQAKIVKDVETSGMFKAEVLLPEYSDEGMFSATIIVEPITTGVFQAYIIPEGSGIFSAAIIAEPSIQGIFKARVGVESESFDLKIKVVNR